MENVLKELLREYIKEQNFTNVNDILGALKEMFRDTEAEMDEVSGYGKCDSIEKTNNNSQNGYSRR